MRSVRIVPMIAGLTLLTTASCGQPQRQSSGLRPAPHLQPVRYTQTGGLAGTSDQMIVSPDGTVAITGPLWGERSGRLSPEQMSALVAAFQGWEALGDHYPAVPGVTDPFEVWLTYGGKTVLAMVDDNDFDLAHQVDPVGSPASLATQLDYLPLPRGCGL